MLNCDPTGAAMVLVVEDDEGIREALGDLLVDAGYQVRVAEHGAQALTVLTSGVVPHLILLDLMMPVMDGWQFLQRLEAMPHLQHVPVITVSAARAAVPARACRSLHKPVDLDMVLTAVERYRLKSAEEAHAACPVLAPAPHRQPQLEV